jgi:hypothetical protein
MVRQPNISDRLAWSVAVGGCLGRRTFSGFRPTFAMPGETFCLQSEELDR